MQHETTLVITREILEAGNPTQRQLEICEAVMAAGSIRQAAKNLGCNPKTVRNAISDVRYKAASRGISPDTTLSSPAAPGFFVHGYSDFHDKETGTVTRQWVKYSAEKKTAAEVASAIVEALSDDIPPVKPTKAKKVKRSNELMACYNIGDHHLGMFAWGEETGEDYDLSIAERYICTGMSKLVDAAPLTKTAFISQLGDFFHGDNTSNQTVSSGHALDVDTRWQKIMQAGIRCLAYIISECLKKHEIVRVRNVAGNHDPHSSIMLSMALEQRYRNEPRVVIETDPSPLFVMTFGKNLVGITHGHGMRLQDLPGILAVEGKDAWTETDFKYIWHGHIHQKRQFESGGVLVESFRTLAARDAWHAGQGYSSGREITCITLDKEGGEVDRTTIPIKLLRKGQARRIIRIS